MTAHRPRKLGALDETAFIEVLFSGAPVPRSGWMLNRHTSVWYPPTDVYETEDYIVVRVEIAGVQSSDFTVALDEQLLSITGVRYEPTSEPRAYHQMEIHYGEFRSDITLSATVDEANIQAEYKDGLLQVTLLKRKPHRLHPR